MIDEPAFTVLRPEGRGGFVLLCDHASNHVPAGLAQLGLAAAELERHIGWDIGAGGVTEFLSKYLDSPAVLCTTSRLVIDCNRHPGADDLIPKTSDGTMIPANQKLDPEARAERIGRWFLPYHSAITALLAGQAAKGITPFILSIHSMSPVVAGIARPWEISLSSHKDRRFVEPVFAAMRRKGGVLIGDNQPYDLDPDVDFTIPHHALGHCRPWLQVEFRQDEVADALGQERWAMCFADALIDA